MGVKTFEKHYTEYHIVCDACGRKVVVKTEEVEKVFNRRDALRMIRWTRRRDGTIHCPDCDLDKRTEGIGRGLTPDRVHRVRYGM